MKLSNERIEKSKSSSMGGRYNQSGVFYQNLVVAEKLINLLLSEEEFIKAEVENAEKAPHIDDLIIYYVDKSIYYQVKHSLDNKEYSVSELREIINKFYKGYLEIKKHQNDCRLVLFTNRRIKKIKNEIESFDFEQYIEEFHIKIENLSNNKIKALPFFSKYKNFLEQLLTDISGDLDSKINFLKFIRFEISQPDINSIQNRIKSGLENALIEPEKLDHLLKCISDWSSFERKEVIKDDIINALDLNGNINPSLAHYYPIDKYSFIERDYLHEEIENRIKDVNGNVLFIQGNPGSGKSSLISDLANKNQYIQYYCYIPNDRVIGNTRYKKDTFLKHLCIEIKRTFPDIKFPYEYSSRFEEKLIDWINILKINNRTLTICIDGIENKPKDFPIQDSVIEALNYQFPENVKFIISINSFERLPENLQIQYKHSENAIFKISGFDKMEVVDFLKKNSLHLESEEHIEKIFQKSNGNPLYLNYILQKIKDIKKEEINFQLDSLLIIDNDLTKYYESIFLKLSSDQKKFLYSIAIFNFPVQEKFIKQISKELAITEEEYKSLMQNMQHFLTFIHGYKIKIYHNSLREYILESFHYSDEIDSLLLKIYDKDADLDESYKSYFELLYRNQKYAEIVELCNEEWLKKTILAFRPYKEIETNIEYALKASIELQSWESFIKITVLKENFQLYKIHNKFTSFHRATQLIYMGNYDLAIEQIYDGENFYCSPKEFDTFWKAYYKFTNSIDLEIIRVFIQRNFNSNKRFDERQGFLSVLSLILPVIEVFQLIDQSKLQKWNEKERLPDRINIEKEERKINRISKQLIINTLSYYKKTVELYGLYVSKQEPEIIGYIILALFEVFLKQKSIPDIERILFEYDFNQLEEYDRIQIFLLLYLYKNRGVVFNERVDNKIIEILRSINVEDLIFNLDSIDTKTIFFNFKIFLIQNENNIENIKKLEFRINSFHQNTTEFLKLQILYDIAKEQNKKQSAKEEIKKIIQELHQYILYNPSDKIQNELKFYLGCLWDLVLRLPDSNEIIELLTYWKNIFLKVPNQLKSFSLVIFVQYFGHSDRVQDREIIHHAINIYESFLEDKGNDEIETLVSFLTQFSQYMEESYRTELFEKLNFLTNQKAILSDNLLFGAVTLLGVASLDDDKAIQEIYFYFAQLKNLPQNYWFEYINSIISTCSQKSLFGIISLLIFHLEQQDFFIPYRNTLIHFLFESIDYEKHSEIAFALIQIMDRWNIKQSEILIMLLGRLYTLSHYFKNEKLIKEVEEYQKYLSEVEFQDSKGIEFINELKNTFSENIDLFGLQLIASLLKEKDSVTLLEKIKANISYVLDPLNKAGVINTDKHEPLQKELIKLLELTKESLTYPDFEKLISFIETFFTGYYKEHATLLVASAYRNTRKKEVEKLIQSISIIRLMVNYDYSLEYLYLETLIEVSDSKKMNSLLMKHIAQMHKNGFSLALYSFINGLKGKRDSETIILVFYNSLKNTLKKNIQYSEVNNEDLPDTTDVKGSKGLLVYFILSLEHEQSMIRELSRNALFYLLKNNPEYFNEIKTMFDTCTKIEAILSIIFSLIIYKLENLIYYKEFLFQCIQYHHFNIKQLAKEVFLFALQKGFSFSESEINDIHSINKIPLLIQSINPNENSKILENYKIVTYLDIIIEEIGKYVDVNEFTNHLFYLLKKKNVFPNSGIINGKLNEKYVKWLNKSVNAISKYDEIIRESINEVLDHYILRKKLKQEDIEQLKYHLRINDPTDLLITKQTEPYYINWIALDYSDSDFLSCKDLENGIEEFITDGEWIDLYQTGYQSYGGQVKEQNKRITHYEIIGFIMNPKMHDRNSINELMDKEWPHIASNNFYRFEGEDIIGEFVFAAYKDKGFTPLLCISDLKYPYNYNHLQATLLPEYKTEWKLEKQNNYNQDYVYNKELVIKNTEWRTCYDEGIRYQYPLSAGHSLRIKKSFLVDYLKKKNLQLGFFVRLTRMNDAKANIHNPLYEKVMLYDFEKELSVKQKNKNTFRLNDFKKSKIFPVFIPDIENREVDLKKINQWINVEHFRVPITQLMLYAQHNCRDKIKTLLEAGANPNLIANDGSTAILLALQSDQFEIAALLLEKTDKTALESQTAIKKITPLEVAIEKLKVDIIDRMLKKGVSVEKRLCLGFETPLYFTIQMIGRLQSNLNIPMDEQDVKELLKSQGQETNTELINELKNYDNYKEILYPFLFGDKDSYSKLLKILDLILDNKPDLEAKNTNNLTALMFAAELGLNEVIEKLLNAKADINCRNPLKNRTALYWAIGNGHIETVKLLLAKGSDKKIKDNFGLTPYQFALKFKKYEIAELLK